MAKVQEAFKYFLAYWFTLTAVPGVTNNTNQFFDFVIASIGFVVVMFLIPYILGFFKIDDGNLIIFLLLSSVITVLYTYILKPGLFGIIYFPGSAVIGMEQDPSSFLRFEVGEFGIIIFVGIVSLLIGTFLTQKFR